MHIALPELDGRIISRPISFKDLAWRSERSQSDVVCYRAAPERMKPGSIQNHRRADFIQQVLDHRQAARLLQTGHRHRQRVKARSLQALAEHIDKTGIRGLQMGAHGGIGYWRYGIERLVELAERGVTLILVPGDDRPDPELSGLSTVNAESRDRLWHFLRQGGLGNALDFYRLALCG